MITTTNEHQIARTIYHQLGGNKFLMMTGARNLAAGAYSLTFNIMRNVRGITHVKIWLNGLDLYDVTFFKIRKHQIEHEETVKNVYAKNLQKVFTDHTGLDTHL